MDHEVIEDGGEHSPLDDPGGPTSDGTQALIERIEQTHHPIDSSCHYRARLRGERSKEGSRGQRRAGFRYQGDGVVGRGGDGLVSEGDGVADRMGLEDHCKEDTNLSSNDFVWSVDRSEDWGLTRLMGVHVSTDWKPR
jgi:hypothetical protein